MSNIIIPKTMDRDERFAYMQECAAYDITEREANSNPAGGFKEGPFARKRTGNPPKVPKVMVTNQCIFNCQYCGMRVSKEKRLRYVCTPREVAEDAVKCAHQNGHGVFITSSIYRNPDYTEELIIETLRIIRTELFYRGYVHAKIMPGTDPALIKKAGMLADRIDVNIEFSHSDGYLSIAKQKNKKTILTPMAFIRDNIKASKNFAPSGQTTQIIAGAMGESDNTLLTLAEALYKKYALRRVYYSGYGVPEHKPDCLPKESIPFWRIRRLYQGDRLLQLYGFKAEDILPADRPFLDQDIDPKAEWALRNLHIYPIEIQKADYFTLLRVPGLGVESANKIINERKRGSLTHKDLKRMGVWMNRAKFFITCSGKYEGKICRGELYGTELLRQMLIDGPGQVKLE